MRLSSSFLHCQGMAVFIPPYLLHFFPHFLSPQSSPFLLGASPVSPELPSFSGASPSPCKCCSPLSLELPLATLPPSLIQHFLTFPSFHSRIVFIPSCLAACLRSVCPLSHLSCLPPSIFIPFPFFSVIYSTFRILIILQTSQI